MQQSASTNHAESTADNPLLERGPLPPFERIQAAHVVPAVRAMLAELNERFDQLEQREAGDDWGRVSVRLRLLGHRA